MGERRDEVVPERVVVAVHPKGIPVVRVPRPRRAGATTTARNHRTAAEPARQHPVPDFLLRNPHAPRVGALLRAVARASLVPSLALSLWGCADSHGGRGGTGAQLATGATRGGGSHGTGGLIGTGGFVGAGGIGTGGIGAGGFVGGGGIGTGGQAGTGGQWVMDGRGWPAPCDVDGRFAPLPSILPDAEYDYAEVGRYRRTATPDGDPRLNLTPLFEEGTACDNVDTATRDACLQDLDATTQQDPCASSDTQCVGFYITATRQAVIDRFFDHDGLMRFLGGVVESPEEALLLAYLAGYELGHPFTSACDGEVVRTADIGGYHVRAYVEQSCSAVVLTLHVATDGTLTANPPDDNVFLCEVGRSTQGLPPAQDPRRLPPGAYLDAMAALEGEAVTAFARLARELRHHGAPQSLIDAAVRAAREEVAHTALVADLARAHGGTGAARPVRTRLPVRDLEAMAVENACEGCVRETLGAVVAHHQAARATDPAVRAVMRRIADEETTHAELSYRVAAFLDTRLDDAARARVFAHRATAIADLHRAATSHQPHPETAALVGMPEAAARKHMLATLSRTLWATA